MLSRLAPLLFRHEPPAGARLHLKAVVGAMFGVLLVGGLAAIVGMPLLMAPLGPTSVLLFAQPYNPSSQPINIFAGYFIAAVLGALAELFWPGTWWTAVLAVGVAMGLMLLLRVTHPPAASVPLTLVESPMEPQLLFVVMLASCVLLVSLAMLAHRIPPRVTYPRPFPKPSDSLEAADVTEEMERERRERSRPD